MAAAEKKFAFQLAAGLATNVLTESKYVKAGYIVVQNDVEQNALKIKTGAADDEDGVVVPGTPIYNVAKGKAYRWLKTSVNSEGQDVYGWVDEQSVSGSFAYKGHLQYTTSLPADALEGDIYTVDSKNIGGIDITDGHNYFVVVAAADEYKKVLIADQQALDVAVAAGTVYVDGGSGTKILITVGSPAATYSSAENYYEKTASAGDKSLKLMSGIDADTYIDEVPTTVDLGGIKKGSVFPESEDWTTSAILKKLLHPYVPFKFTSAVLDSVAKEYEYGTQVNVTDFTVNYELGSVAMTNCKVATSDNSKVLFDSAAVPASGKKTALTTSDTLDGTTNVSYTVTLLAQDPKIAADKTELQKVLNYKFAKHYYVCHLAPGAAIPTAFDSSTMVNIGNATEMAKGINVTVAQDERIVFICPDATKKQIQQYITGEWNNTAPTPSNQATPAEFETETGARFEHVAFSTNSLNAGTYLVRIN